MGGAILPLGTWAGRNPEADAGRDGGREPERDLGGGVPGSGLICGEAGLARPPLLLRRKAELDISRM